MRHRQIKMTDFSKKVISWIKKIPRGKVASYGQIAKLAGKPQGARGVGWILHSCTEVHGLPWHRVLNSKGKISFRPSTSQFVRQKSLLQAEGVLFVERGQVDIDRHRWNKEASRPRTSRGAPQMFRD